MGVLFSCILKKNRLMFKDMRAIVLGVDPEMQAMNIKKQWTDIYYDVQFENVYRLLEWSSILEFAQNIEHYDNEEFQKFTEAIAKIK